MASFLSPSEMAQLRADASDTLLDESCTVLSLSSTTNAIGERVDTWGTAGTAVPCRLCPSGASTLVELAGVPTLVAVWNITLPYGTIVPPGSRIVIDGATYEAKQSWEEETWATASRIDAMRIE